MEKTSAAFSRAAAASSVTHTGSPTPIRGSGRPAPAAAARMVGTMWDSTVAGPVIQVTVPVAIRPAIPSMVVPRAATSTMGGGASICSGPNVEALSVSPTKDTCSPSRSGIRMERYSLMWRAGFSNDSPKTFSITNWWDSPMPRVNRPPVAAWTVRA